MNWDKQKSRWRVTFDKTIDGKRIRKSTLAPKGCTEAEARKFEESFVRRIYLPYALNAGAHPVWTDYVNSLSSGTSSWIDEALNKCRYRSRLRKMPCTITRDDIVMALMASGGRCAVTGMPFSNQKFEGRKYRPMMHSIDRIDSAKGYVWDNVRIICAGVNIGMMHWGEDLFGQFAVGYVLLKYGVHPAAQAALAASREKSKGEN